MSRNTEDRVRAAFDAKAARVTPETLSPARPPLDGDLPANVRSLSSPRRIRWFAPVLAAAAVIGVAVGTAAIISTPSAHRITPGGPTNSVVPSPFASDTVAPTETSAPHPSGTSVTTVPASKPPLTGTENCYFIDFRCPVPSNYVYYQPLWPFPDYAAEQDWQGASASNGSQPWHLDAGQTALLFAQNYLGFTDITTVTSTKEDHLGAHVGVGYPLPNGQPHTAAVLHLVRFSPVVGDRTAGWEVVGSDDTDFSLERPAYGSQVSSPMTVGGHITGVDENITVVVLPQPANSSSGSGLSAGGTNSPWQLSVEFSQRGVLTIVASTGGHLTQHERFAIQGVHT